MPVPPKSKPRTTIRQWFFFGLALSTFIGVVLSQTYILKRTAHAAAFTSGNLVVYRVGDGGAPLSGPATAVFLDEYPVTGGTPVQTIAMPTVVNGSNKRLTASGTATSEGLLTRSTDGNYLTVTGYDAAVSTASPNSVSSSSINRVIGRVDASGSVDTTTALTDAATGGNVRSAVSTNGTNLWVDGSTGGIRYTTLGATTSTALSTATPLNNRQVNIFNNQLYVGSASGTFQGVSTVGSGTPTTSGQTVTLLPGFPTASGPSPYGFVFFNATTLYVADDRGSSSGGGLQKWTFNSGTNTWSLVKTFTTGLASSIGIRGLTMSVNGSGQPVFYATTTESSANRIVTVTDTGSAGDSFTTVVTAPANTAFRGVAFAPGAVVTPSPSPSPVSTPTPSLSINNVSQDEGNAGTTNFNFTVSLDSPAQTGGVSFTVNTADGTSNPATAGTDYVAIVGGSGSIPEGSSSTQVTVQVNGDMTTEANETFFVNISGVTRAGVTDAQGLGTIQNDDITITPIHDIQGNGQASPFVGQSVTTTGIVTGRKTNGYFIQDPTADADPNTSEGMFVFTSSAPSAGINVGDSVRVTGTVAEFIAGTSDEPVSPSNPKTATELTSPTTTILSSGNPLPAPLTEAIFISASPSRSAELEKYEYMRVSVSSLTVTEPTNNNFGEFWGVTTGTPRPFREPGIESGDPIPAADNGAFAGSVPPNIPIFDGNFERIMVDSDEATNTSNTRRSAIFVTSGAVITGLVGPLDYSFDNYRIVLDFGASTSVTPGITAATPVPTPTAGEFTISHTNLENFSSSNATKLNKASLAIRNVLHTPDVLGLIEVDSTASAQALANKINADVGNSLAVNYVVYFNDTGATQDIGYLVNSARVTVNGAITPYHQSSTFTYCGVANQTLHDRPSLILSVDFPQPGGGTVPVTVILNHTKSLIGVDSQLSYGSCGTGTEGARNREKRRLQAEDIADLIQSHINENLVVLGDMNAFDFNDGLQDMVGTLKGTPAPANQVVEPSTDRWTYTLTNLINTLPADQRYSFAFEGNAQALDHVLVNSAMLARNSRYAYARFNGDFSNDFATNANTPERVADHDAPVAYFNVTLADVSITKTLDTTGPYYSGGTVSYTLDVANAGPDTATNIQVSDTPTNLTITTVTGSGCTALPCTIPSLSSGTNTNITVTATIDAAAAFDNSATATAAEFDPNSSNNTDNTGNGGTAGASADVSITKSLDTSGPYIVGQTITYTLAVANAGPSTATNIQVTDTPTNLTITNVSGACTSFSPCTIASLASTANTSITVTATIDAPGAFDNSATATAAEFDPNSSNNTDNTGNGGTAGAVPPTLNINDVPQVEGNASTTTFNFTVSLTGPAGPGGVSFNVNTADGTTNPATAGSDYVAITNGAGSISEGNTSTTVSVTVSGDTTPELDETFFVNISNISGATTGDVQGLGTILNDDEAASDGQVIISEFRFRGPGPIVTTAPKTGAPVKSEDVGIPSAIGTPQDNDEYIEFYNNTNSNITVATTDGSAGWSLVGADGAVRFTIPIGTMIPAHGHYLAADTAGYSLNGYALPDITYSPHIPDGSGVALFRTANPANFTLAERLDAAGYTGVDQLYREGAGFPLGGAEIGGNIEYCFFRKMTRATGGLPKDAGDNAADFLGVSTNGAATGQGTYLGAPGPENLASPINRTAQFSQSLLDPSVSSSTPPNRLRSFIAVTNGANGTMSVRRIFTNNTGAPVGRLRFRIVEITTFTAPPVAGQADLRALNSSDFTVMVNGNPVNVKATTVEEPPTQPSGGAWNTSLKVGYITLAAPLGAGQSVAVDFLLGVQTAGTFTFFINIEALPVAAPPPL